LHSVDPERLFQTIFRQKPVASGPRGWLFWGKAADRSWEVARAQRVIQPEDLVLVITPQGPGEKTDSRFARYEFGALRILGEHPIPGAGSFEAGRSLLEFFDVLRRRNASQLDVFLSGGASSLAWLPHLGVSLESLQRRLEQLYRLPIPIQEMNQKRSQLCSLKAGGAADWLSRIAPDVRTHVHVISDVAPFGPEVVGSGPFWNGKTRHEILADNGIYAQAFVQALSGGESLTLGVGCLGTWESWIRRFEREIETLEKKSQGMTTPVTLILAGEPQVDVPQHVSKNARGGRMAQFAGGLALSLAPLFHEGRLELLAASSDGVDGRSGGAGVNLDRDRSKLWAKKPEWTRLLAQGLSSFDCGRAWQEVGALIPAQPTGTNVQDLVALRWWPHEAPSPRGFKSVEGSK
jgi:glycerate-2-kinase